MTQKITLQSIVRGKQVVPTCLTLYGPEGIGKTTFAASAPKPLFVQADPRGSAQLDVARVNVETVDHVHGVIDLLLTDPSHGFETLVIDTIDWIEPMIFKVVCEENGWKSIEDPGYGKGFVPAADRFRDLMFRVERVAKKMNVIFLAHAQVKNFNNPEGLNYDRYELKLCKQIGGVLKEWGDALLFANYETFVGKNEQKRIKGVDNGARLIHSRRTAAFDAKNRYGLPEKFPLSWDEYAKRVSMPFDPAEMVADIRRKAAEIGGEFEQKVLDFLKGNESDHNKLIQLNNRVNIQLTQIEKETQQ